MSTQLDGSLSANELDVLRINNVIESNEIAFRYGDLYVAENVVTRQRRQLQGVALLLREGRQVLKG
jgi:hypothetical protein